VEAVVRALEEEIEELVDDMRASRRLPGQDSPSNPIVQENRVLEADLTDLLKKLKGCWVLFFDQHLSNQSSFKTFDPQTPHHWFF
jgi:hypothetical protein